MLLQPKQLSGIIPVRRQPLISAIDALLASAWARYDSTSIVGTNPVTEWQNVLGIAARDLDVVVGTDANLITLESGVAWLSGMDGDYISSSSLSISSSIVQIAWIAPADWTPPLEATIVGQYNTTGNQRGFLFTLTDTGALRQYISSTGTDLSNGTSTVAVNFADGTGHWVASVWDDSAGNVNFYTSDLPSTSTHAEVIADLTLLGAPDIALAVAGLHISTQPLEISGFEAGTGSKYTGKIARVFVASGSSLSASPIINFDARKFAVNSSTAIMDTGETWTAEGDAFVNATNYTGIYSRGSVGLETTAGQLIAKPGTVFIVYKPTLAAPPADQLLTDSRSSGDRWVIATSNSNADKWQFFQGGTPVTITQAFDNNLRVITVQVNGDATTKITVSDVGSTTGDAGSTDWDFGTVFSSNSSSQTSIGLALEFIVFDRAISAVEIALVQEYLGAKYA